MNYTRLSLAEVRRALLDVAQDAQSTFGGLDARQLNWRPDVTRWSVAQCFEHLHTANGLMYHAAKHALCNPPTTIWQRLPLQPRIFGQLLIRSQAPQTKRKFTAPATARPTLSEIPEDILHRFIDQQCDAAQWVATIDQSEAARKIMISPFIRVVTYSVLDGLRLVVAHNHRHFQQARRVTESTEFPAV